jgi:hypothetical protein
VFSAPDKRQLCAFFYFIFFIIGMRRRPGVVAGHMFPLVWRLAVALATRALHAGETQNGLRL